MNVKFQIAWSEFSCRHRQCNFRSFEFYLENISGHMTAPTTFQSKNNSWNYYQRWQQQQAVTWSPAKQRPTQANCGKYSEVVVVVAVETRSEAESSSWQSTFPLIHSLTCGNYYNCISSQAENWNWNPLDELTDCRRMLTDVPARLTWHQGITYIPLHLDMLFTQIFIKFQLMEFNAEFMQYSSRK